MHTLYIMSIKSEHFDMFIARFLWLFETFKFNFKSVLIMHCVAQTDLLEDYFSKILLMYYFNVILDYKNNHRIHVTHATPVTWMITVQCIIEYTENNICCQYFSNVSHKRSFWHLCRKDNSMSLLMQGNIIFCYFIFIVLLWLN